MVPAEIQATESVRHKLAALNLTNGMGDDSKCGVSEFSLMTTENRAETELDQVRRLLLGPFEQNNDARDQRIKDFIRDETMANAAQLDRMEKQLREITAVVNKARRETLSELSKAISDLAQDPAQHVAEPGASEPPENVRELAATRKTS